MCGGQRRTALTPTHPTHHKHPPLAPKHRLLNRTNLVLKNQPFWGVVIDIIEVVGMSSQVVEALIMNESTQSYSSNDQAKILIVDDEWSSNVIKNVKRRIEQEGWNTITVVPEPGGLPGDEFEAEALYTIEVEKPDGVLLDVRFGEHKDD